MLIDNLSLHNFGVFEGRHVVDLAPPSESRPVMLFGGLNGRGKTTFMDAMRLVLYGKLAQTSNRGNLPYEDYLKSCIHRAVPTDEGASVGMRFSYTTEGVEHEYNVRRLWKGTGSGVRERIQVLKDGHRDRVLEENWPEFVESLLPNRVSQLFFFDGERVEELANPESASGVLATAVAALLGLDVVDRLTTDLQVLERRKKKKGAKPADREDIRRFEVELAEAGQRLDVAKQDRARAQASLDQVSGKLRACNARLQRQGDEIGKRREALETQVAEEREVIGGLDAQLEALAYASLPLALVEPMLRVMLRQTELENESLAQVVVGDALRQRNTRLLTWLRGRSKSKTLLADVERFLRADLAQHSAPPDGAYLKLSGATQAQLDDLLAKRLARERATRSRLLEAREAALGRLDDAERGLAALPAPESLAELLVVREELSTRRRLLEVERQALDQSVLQTERLEATLKQRLAAKLEGLTMRELEREDSERLLRFSARARETLAVFRQRVLEARISSLETQVLGCFQQLLAKEKLVETIRIDPSTFSLTVFGSDGDAMPTDRLSAGERQLLAVSILWGLAKASGRRLPVVVDTPMGRLDSSHRSNLVERYFPFASHQVVLLSTDKEIDESAYRRLEPAVGRAYNLDYSSEAKSTTVRNGYFWES